jgi:pyruvate/2-oxoglutarate dehydrogenase complex dihydrolipoamide acyltransferase (E2) component
MNLRIEFPVISPAIKGGVVVRWHKEVGDLISYGDDLFDIAVDEVIRIRRRLGASVRSPGKPKYRKLTDVTVRYRVSSMESGILAGISAVSGGSIRVGDVVGYLTAPGELADPNLPAARLTTNVLDPGAA